jgi:site-specific DNA-methyltransferase (adenine-specific)
MKRHLKDIVSPKLFLKKHKNGKSALLLKGDCIIFLKRMKSNSVDLFVVDGPYGLSISPDVIALLKCWLEGKPYIHPHAGINGKEWDSNVLSPEVWMEVLRVLKPGGKVISFYHGRTYDLGTIAMRIAGLKIIAQGMWVRAQGSNPGSNVSNGFRDRGDEISQQRWDGWDTLPRVVHEPFAVAQKPINENTLLDHFSKNGPAGLFTGSFDGNKFCTFPKMVINDGSEEVKAMFGDSSKSFMSFPITDEDKENIFFCNLPTANEKDAGLSHLPSKFIYQNTDGVYGKTDGRRKFREKSERKNNHPTVKPVSLKRYICRTWGTPGGVVADICAGSGTTGIGALLESMSFIGMEMVDEHFDLACARLKYTCENPDAFINSDPYSLSAQRELEFVLAKLKHVEKCLAATGTTTDISLQREKLALEQRVEHLKRQLSQRKAA